MARLASPAAYAQTLGARAGRGAISPGRLDAQRGRQRCRAASAARLRPSASSRSRRARRRRSQRAVGEWRTPRSVRPAVPRRAPGQAARARRSARTTPRSPRGFSRRCTTFTTPPTRWTIVQTDSAIVVTTNEGKTTRLAPTGKKIKDDNTKTERKTKWDGGKLVSEISGLGPGHDHRALLGRYGHPSAACAADDSQPRAEHRSDDAQSSIRRPIRRS